MNEMLSFDLQWDANRGETPTDATWGRLSFSVGGNLFWGLRTDKGPTGFVWTWIDLLEHLAEVWPWLELEDGWPRGIAPQTPRDFESVVRNLLVDLPTSRRVKEEQRLFEFRGHHDLSRALQGAIAPSLWVVREGHQMWLGSSTRDIKLSAAHVLETIEHLGDMIDQRIAHLDDERAREVHADWNSRCALGPQEKLGIVTGMGREQIIALAGEAAMSWFEAEEESLKPTEIMAAARMSGAIAPTHVLRQIVDWIRSVPFCETPEIDRLSEDCPQGWAALHRSPAEEGYVLATWLREVVGGWNRRCVWIRKRCFANGVWRSRRVGFR